MKEIKLFIVKIDYINTYRTMQMVNWCVQKWGPGDSSTWRWDHRLSTGLIFEFINEGMMTEFILTWN